MFVNREILKHIRRASLFALSFIIFICEIGYADSGRFRDYYSKSAIVSDVETGRILYEKNADNIMAMASLSKMMTLLITFDSIKEKKVDPNDVVDILQTDVNREGTNMKLEKGDKIILKDLMNGMMIISANDAALAISRYVSGDYSSFVKKMNDKAKEIGMKNTVFYNPNGLPMTVNNSSIENHTTARDVLILSKWLYKHYPNKLIEITNKERFIYKNKGINEENTNPLLPMISDVDGLKTGYTDKAGYCLSCSMKISSEYGNDVNNRLIGVTMGLPSKSARKEVPYSILKYISKHYKTKVIYKNGEVVSTVNINGNPLFKSSLVSENGVVVVKRDTENLKTNIVYKRVRLLSNPNSPAAVIEISDSRGNILNKVNLYPEGKVSNLSFFKRGIICLNSLIYSLTHDINDTKINDKYPIYTFN